MAITSAVQKGTTVYVYNGNRQLFSKQGTLQGYTSTSVSVIHNKVIYTYNEQGRQISSKPM